jgi:hypothetical protein
MLGLLNISRSRLPLCKWIDFPEEQALKINLLSCFTILFCSPSLAFTQVTFLFVQDSPEYIGLHVFVLDNLFILQVGNKELNQKTTCKA